MSVQRFQHDALYIALSTWYIAQRNPAKRPEADAQLRDVVGNLTDERGNRFNVVLPTAPLETNPPVSTPPLSRLDKLKMRVEGEFAQLSETGQTRVRGLLVDKFQSKGNAIDTRKEVLTAEKYIKRNLQIQTEFAALTPSQQAIATSKINARFQSKGNAIDKLNEFAAVLNIIRATSKTK